MSAADEHRKLAEAALLAAEELREAHPLWALVPLFYSAMHLMHARFDEDELAADERHPSAHRKHFENGVELPGTRDVVTRRYPQLSRDYRSLDTVSRVVRYKEHPLMSTERFWDEYDRVAKACGARSSIRGS